MIAYFDTSAVIPLLVEEPGSEPASRLWDDAEHVVSVRLVYAEARAALAHAERVARLRPTQLGQVVRDLEDLYHQLDLVEVDDTLVRRAGELAQLLGLRGYDAVHLAAAERLADAELVMVAGDQALLTAAVDLGLATADTSSV